MIQSVSIVAASSIAFSRVTSTFFFDNSLEPSAILMVNIAGKATGMAANKSTSVSGKISRSAIPLSNDIKKNIKTATATIANCHLVKPETTDSICD